MCVLHQGNYYNFCCTLNLQIKKHQRGIKIIMYNNNKESFNHDLYQKSDWYFNNYSLNIFLKINKHKFINFNT